MRKPPQGNETDDGKSIKLKFKILNAIKYFGGGVFSVGCIITGVAFVGPFVARYVTPDLAFDSLAIWEKGILLTCVGFALFFLGWILSKSSSSFGFRYRDWRARRIGRAMGSSFVLTVVVWLVSLLVFKIQPALVIFADARPVIWIFGFLATFILIGSYMGKIRTRRMSILDLFSPALTFFGVLGVVGAFAFVWYGIPFLIQNPQILSDLPPNYYETAGIYVTLNYGKIDHTYNNLESFLMRLEPFPPYSMNTFDCTESSALLEWLLEGAGFDASIAASSFYEIFPHTWVVVNLPNGNSVNIEATIFTQNYYNPPGIVSGWQQLGLGASVDYDNPAEVFGSPIDAVRRLVVYIERSEWDWWNAAPYNNLEPFSEWD